MIILVVAYLTNRGCKLVLQCKRQRTTMTVPLDTYGKVGGAVLGPNVVYLIDALIVRSI